MEPKSFSATAFQVANACLRRYHAEQIGRGRGISTSTAATIGTTVHAALEMYVKAVYLEKTEEKSIKLLLALFQVAYTETFGSADFDTEDFADGIEMLQKWFMRNHIDDTVEVISCEVKESFMIPTSIGEIPFNYIWDRFDKLEEGIYRVVDYKSVRWAVQPADLKKKIQARCYGLAAQIRYPQAKEIWVEFDLLRHAGSVGIKFTRADNVATWHFIKAEAQRIVDAPDDAPPTLNGECLFCPVKIDCPAVMKNIGIGGIMDKIGKGPTEKDWSEVVDIRAALQWQGAAVSAAINELDGVIMPVARKLDMFEFDSDVNKMSIVTSGRRGVDPDFTRRVIGAELFDRYGGLSFTVAAAEKLLKGNELTDVQKKQLRGLIRTNPGQPRLKIEAKNPIDED